LHLIAGLPQPRTESSAIQLAHGALTPVAIRFDEGDALLRYALYTKRPIPLAHAGLYCSAISGLFALFARERVWLDPLPVTASVGTRGATYEYVRRQMTKHYPWELRKVLRFQLTEDDSVEDERVHSILARLPRAERLMPALGAYGASWREREDGGSLSDREFISEWSRHADRDSIAGMIVHAYRAIEEVLGGPLPSRSTRLGQRMSTVLPGISPRHIQQLSSEIRHIESTIRGPAAHGASHGHRSDLRAALRVQRLARNFLRRAL
jgi:hypothetical protein